MTTISYSDFRANLSHFLTLAEENAEEIVVSRGKGRNSVVLPLQEFLSLQETAYLLSSVKNRKHLGESLKDHEQGNVIKVELS